MDLETFKQLVNIRDGMYEIVIDNSFYRLRFSGIYEELDRLIMDITEEELESE